ncbi:hypothetical protein MO973_22205 [Paenibacillus sp. TRM 82003]|nr:hypothetical protein [Paenibacillus sp. TRM 82003]
MAKRVRVKNYSSMVRKAPQRVKARGKVKIKGYVGGGGSAGGTFGAFSGAGAYGTTTCQPFVGPTLQQRLYGWAVASTLVTVNLENSSFRGRVISVDGNGFEVTVTDPCTSVFTIGAIVYVNFNQVNAVSAGSY